MYSITTTHIFKDGEKRKRTPVAMEIKKKLPSALKAAKDSIKRHPCPYHPNMGLTSAVIKDEDEHVVGGWVGYRDGQIKPIIPKEKPPASVDNNEDSG